MKTVMEEIMIAYYSPEKIHNFEIWLENNEDRLFEKEKEQMGYSKADVIKAGEMGEINHHDTKHLVSYLDEAKRYNETFNTNEK